MKLAILNQCLRQTRLTALLQYYNFVLHSQLFLS